METFEVEVVSTLMRLSQEIPVAQTVEINKFKRIEEVNFTVSQVESQLHKVSLNIKTNYLVSFNDFQTLLRDNPTVSHDKLFGVKFVGIDDGDLLYGNDALEKGAKEKIISQEKFQNLVLNSEINVLYFYVNNVNVTLVEMYWGNGGICILRKDLRTMSESSGESNGDSDHDYLMDLHKSKKRKTSSAPSSKRATPNVARKRKASSNEEKSKFKKISQTQIILNESVEVLLNNDNINLTVYGSFTPREDFEFLFTRKEYFSKDLDRDPLKKLLFRNHSAISKLSPGNKVTLPHYSRFSDISPAPKQQTPTSSPSQQPLNAKVDISVVVTCFQISSQSFISLDNLQYFTYLGCNPKLFKELPALLPNYIPQAKTIKIERFDFTNGKQQQLIVLKVLDGVCVRRYFDMSSIDTFKKQIENEILQNEKAVGELYLKKNGSLLQEKDLKNISGNVIVCTPCPQKL